MKKAKPLNIQNSESLWRRGILVTPMGVQTFSKGPNQYVEGVAPKYIERGKGSHVWDVDKNEYIDYTMALGPITLGYCYDAIDQAICEQLKKGITLPLIHPIEVEVSEMLRDVIPCAEMVRFAKNGSDATTGAIRVARAYTGRDLVVVCGYHGWHDWYIGSTTRNLGVPEATQKLTLKFQYNDLDSLKKVFKQYPEQIACVIIEPVEFEPPKKGFLNSVKEITHANGAILIFDEIITAFRLAIGGAQEYYGVIPDLATLGKGVANGMPMGILCGRADIMRLFKDVFLSFTFGGETLSLAAVKRGIEIFKKEPVIQHMAHIGSLLRDGLNTIASELGISHFVKGIGLDFWPAFLFTATEGWTGKQLQSLFQQEIVRRGILARAGMMICYSHSEEDVQKTIEVFRKSLEVVKKAVKTGNVLNWLDGKVIATIIRDPSKTDKLT